MWLGQPVRDLRRRRGDPQRPLDELASEIGVRKADVRTVIHLALPGSVEGYYQELGRAGRDGLPARAILLYSWVDRRTHEFFHERDYPPASVLQQLHRVLTDDPQKRRTWCDAAEADYRAVCAAAPRLRC